MLSRLTHKRGKQVWIPLHPELFFALDAEFVRRHPRPDDHVLLNPDTSKPMSRPRLYERMLALGLRAEVARAHPHRFRDTLAVDMLLKGASPYDVAKTLGDPQSRSSRSTTRRTLRNFENGRDGSWKVQKE
jgi:integrase